MYRTALDVAKRKFSPEFMNRLDKVVVFRTLTERICARYLISSSRSPEPYYGLSVGTAIRLSLHARPRSSFPGRDGS